jgi:HEAT repeat protein
MGFVGDGSDGDDNLQRKPLPEPSLADAGVLKQLRVAAQDSEPVVRHLAAYALANVSGPESIEQLKVMLLDGDRRTRANAVMGLARNGVPDAIPELQKMMAEVQQPVLADASLKSADETERLLQQRMWQAEQPILARNCLRAVRDLWFVAAADQRQALQAATVAIGSAELFAADVRNQARELQQWMEQKPK